MSRVAGREGDSFVSPSEQRDRIAAACRRDGMELIGSIDELDVSGGAPLEQRDGLLRAVEAVEAGHADVLLVAYFDRLFRSLRVQGEVVSRVEAAGGRVLALDFGEVTGATAVQWISGTLIGAVAEYHRRSTKERSAAAQARAVDRGVAPFPLIPPGYRRGDAGVLEPSELAPVVVEAFAMRARGETIKAVRAFLRAGGVERSYHGVQAMLRSRIYLGEISFGGLHNPAAHEPLVDVETWSACQSAPRGARAKSDRLLARLGVLRCASCGSRLVVGVQTSKGRRYPFYRCPPTGDCSSRPTIGAEIVEAFVVDRVRDRLVGIKESASAENEAVAADARERAAQERVDKLIRAFADMPDEPAALEAIREAREERDAAAAEAHRLRGLRSALTVSGALDWDRLSLKARRALVAAVVESVTVSKGRGLERLALAFRE